MEMMRDPYLYPNTEVLINKFSSAERKTNILSGNKCAEYKII